MRNILTQKISFLIRNGYRAKDDEIITQFEYNDLTPEKQKEYISIDGESYGYYNKVFFVDFPYEQIKEIALYEFDFKISKILRCINTIKKCIMFFTILYILNFILTFFFAL